MKNNSTRDSIINKIKNNNSRREYILFQRIFVFVKDPLPENISVQSVLDKVEKTLPFHFVTEIDSIYIGQFDHLDQREVTSVYNDGAIYITNEQDDEADIIDDIIHEAAHAVEEKYGYDIFFDGEIEQEFFGKRETLFRLLNDALPDGTNLSRDFYTNINYDNQFDNFLYKDVGYDRLDILTASLFYSPYGATSMREYFANGFEAFFLKKDGHHLKDVSPKLYKKMIFLNEME